MHGHQKFDKLLNLVNYYPEKLTKSYIRFITECMKRNYLPSVQTC